MLFVFMLLSNVFSMNKVDYNFRRRN